MIFNYLKIAFRTIRKDLFYTILNVSGLSIGIAVFVLIGYYVLDEIQYDQFHKKADRIYLMTSEFNGKNGKRTSSTSQIKWHSILQDQIPDIEKVTRITTNYDEVLITANEKRFYETNIKIVDTSFFSIFDFPLINKTTNDLFSHSTDAVITESIAQKYFGTTDAIGQLITIDNQYDFTVTGVISDPPAKSHIQFSILLPITHLYETADESRLQGKVANFYLLLNQNSDPELVDKKIYNLSEELRESGEIWASSNIIPLSQVYLYGFEGKYYKFSEKYYVILFSTIASLILIISTINYTNLAISRYLKRSKEIGIRKTIGSNRLQIIYMVILETLVYCTISVLVAFALIELLSPWLGLLLENKVLSFTYGWKTIVLAVSLIAGATLLSGLYPAIFLSNYKPTRLFNSQPSGQSRLRLKSMLVLIQFVITQTLIISTLFIQYQLSYTRNKDHGFEIDNVIIIPTHNELNQHSASVKDQMEKINGVENVTFASGIPGENTQIRFYDSESIEDYKGNANMVVMNYISSDRNLLPIFGMELSMGNNFEALQNNDSTDKVIINEEAARQIGWDDPIGKAISFREGEVKYISGVVKDFHMASLKETIDPLIIESNGNKELNFLILKVRSTNINNLINSVENVWDSTIPHRPIEFFFLDDHFNNMYRKEQQLSYLFTCFAILSITIALLGLIGLTAYSLEQRQKELSVRKVLGASFHHLMITLSKEFTIIILVSAFFSILISWKFINYWLGDFVYKIDFSFIKSMLVVMGTILVSWTLISLLAAKAIRTNPAKVLRDE